MSRLVRRLKTGDMLSLTNPDGTVSQVTVLKFEGKAVVLSVAASEAVKLKHHEAIHLTKGLPPP